MFAQNTTIGRLFFTRPAFSPLRGVIILGALIGLASGLGCVSPGVSAATSNAQGVDLYVAGDYDGAIDAFESSLEENPDSAETYYNLGSAYQRKATATGDYNLLTKAEDAYWKALESNPADETIVCCYRGIATSATARGDSASAMATLEEWRDRNPDSIEPKLEIAYLLEAQGRDDDAYEALQAAAQMAPNDYRAYYKMGVLAERAGDLNDAMEQTKLAAKLTPENDDVARRARTLESQCLAQRRANLQDQNAVASKDSNVPSSEQTQVAAYGSVLPADQTTVVAPTAAQTEETEPPEIVLPNDETTPPQTSTNGAGTKNPTSASNEGLGFGAVSSFSSVDASKNDDSDVKWITNSSPASKIVQTTAEIPQTKEETTPKPRATQAVFVASSEVPQASPQVQEVPTQTNSTPEQTAALATTSASVQNSTTQTTTNNLPRTTKVLPKRKRLRDFNSGPPSTTAGATF